MFMTIALFYTVVEINKCTARTHKKFEIAKISVFKRTNCYDNNIITFIYYVT